jgi:choline dehydrogenase-like flavoprotein
MLSDARTVSSGTTLDYDVCIVGGGAAGITVAVELMGTPVRVCLLESGGLVPDQATQQLYRGESVGHPYYPLDVPRLRYFGGTTNHWSGDCRPLERSDLDVRSWVPESGWSLTYEEIESVYPRAHEILDLGPHDYSPEHWSYGRARALNFDSSQIVTRVSQFSAPTRFGGKFRADLERAANVHVFLNANATEIADSRKDRGSVRVACLSGTRFTIRARAVVMAAGGIENARLLLASTADGARGLGNDRDLVGRFFMDHLSLETGLIVPAAQDLSMFDLYELPARRLNAGPRGVPTKAYLVFTAETMRRLSILNVSAIMSRAWLPPSQESPAYHALQRAIARPSRLWSQIKTMIEGWDDVVSGLYWKAFEQARPLRLYTVRFMTEQAPNRDSRVTLGNARDALGVPVAKLDWRLNELDYHSIRMASRQLAVELGRSGLGRMQPWCAHETDEEIDRRITAGAHHMGTTRMHSDPSRGVVDTQCRVHGTRNVYVASSSVFPTAGHAAPTITIVALAIRLARHLRAVLE